MPDTSTRRLSRRGTLILPKALREIYDLQAMNSAGWGAPVNGVAQKTRFIGCCS